MFKLPSLPYAEDALEPAISAKTLGVHHGKHHKGYVDKLNKLVAGTRFEDASLERLIRETAGQAGSTAIFNNAAQAWNHAFYWSSLRPKGGGNPRGPFGELVGDSFGGLDAFKQAFAKAAEEQFGSGWAWLVLADDRLEIVTTSNAEVPFTKGRTALLTVDVWEHAYYLDYQNKRADYLKAVIDSHLNWDFADANWTGARQPAKTA